MTKKQNLLDFLEGHLLVTGETVEFFDLTGVFVEFPEEKREWVNEFKPNERFKPLLIEEPFQRMENYVNFVNMNQEQFIEMMREFKKYCEIIDRKHIYQAFYMTLKIIVRDKKVEVPVEIMTELEV